MRNLATTFYRDNQVYVFAIFTSILLSLLIGYRNSVINPDGICYVLGAQMLNTSSIKGMMQLCPQSQWPFYSTLIYALGQVSHLSYAASAHLLNGLLSLVSVITFIKIVESLGANQRVMWLAALVMLFDHQFNILRDNIIRDHGFWAFYLISIYLLLKYFREPKWITAILWSASLLIATLFRIEGAVFLVALPFVSFLNIKEPLLKRLQSFFNLNAILILLYAGYFIWKFLQPEQLRQLGRVDEIIHQIKNGLFILADRYQNVKGAFTQYVLPGESSSDAGVIVLMVWISWFFYNVVISLSWCYALLLYYALKSRSLVLSSKNAPVIFGYLSINLLMTLAFLAENLFISKRYLIALTFVLMLWLPFAVNDLIVKWSSLRHRLFLIFITIVFFGSALGGVVEFGRSKFYIRTAGDWIASEIPHDAKLYVNDFQLMYYSDHFGLHIFETLPGYLQKTAITDGKWKNYDYLALRLRKKGETEPVLRELIDITPMKIFSDRHGNRIAVYKLTQNK